LTQEGEPAKLSTLKHRVAKIAVAADVKASKHGAHTFRHTFAVEFIRAGGDVFSLQKILGHSTLEMTREYVHLGKTDIREAHRKFSPVSRML
jgi:site-specific recombinase XerD